MADDISLRLELTGEQKFSEAIKRINSGLKVNQSELKLVAAQYGKASNSMDGLRAHGQALEGAILSQKDKVLVLEEALKNAASKYGEASARTLKLQSDLNDANATLHKYTNSLAENNEKMKEAENPTNQHESGVKKLGDAHDEAGKKVTSFATIVKASAIGNLIASSIKKGLSAMQDFISAGVEYNATLERIHQSLEETFGEKGAESIRRWSSDSMDSFGLSEKNALDYASSLKMLGESTGMVSGKSTEMAKGISELTGKWSLFKGMEPDRVFSILETALNGSYKSMRELNVSMNQNTLQAFENANGQGRLVSKMTENEKMWLRYNFLISASEKQMKDWDSSTKTLSGSQVILKQRLEEFSGKLAEEFVPVLTEMLTETNNYLKEHGDTLSNLGQIIATVINVFANLVKIIAAVPPEVLAMVGMIAASIKVYVSLKKALDPVKGSLGAVTKAMSVGSKSADMLMVKVLALAAALSVLLFLILAIKEGTDKAAKSMDSIGKNMNNLPNPNVNIPKQRGFAKGTSYAPPGLAWVGEKGPELVRFRGGERVWNAGQSAKMAGGAAYTDNSQLILNVHGIEEMQQVVNWFQGRRIKARAGGTL